MKKVRYLIMALVILIPSLAMAIPQLVNYQGRLTDNLGNPVTGSKSIVFSLYTVSTGGSNVWTETQTVSATNGIFNVLFGSVTALPGSVFDNAELYLGIKVEADAEMTPRQRIASVGYAYKAAGGDAPFNVTQTGNNVSATFYINNVNNTATALTGSTNGKGSAGWFLVDNTSSTALALWVQHSGSGVALQAKQTGPGDQGYYANAGWFEITNTANAFSAIYAKTAGSGAAVYGYNPGTGYAGFFNIDNQNNGNASLFARTQGTSFAGNFEIANTSNSSSALRAATNGTGLAGRFVGGDVFIETQGKGLVLRATDGANCFRVTVNDAGTLSTASVTCP